MSETIKKMSKKILFLSAALIIGFSFFVGAKFAAADATFSIGLNPSGMDGTIVSSPAGINCSVINGTPGLVSGTCGANFSASTTVTLTATPASGSIFTSWNTWYNNSGGCTGSSPTCTLTMNKDYVLGAIFDSAQPPITTYSISLNPSGMNGTIVSSPAGINCSVVIGTTGYVSGTCGANFPAGTTVTLTATPASGNVFTSWSTWYNNSGGCTGSSPTCTLTMNKDYVLGAIFSSAPDLTISELSTFQENGKIYLKVKINNSGAATPNGKVIGVKVEDLNTGDIYTSNYSNSLTGSAILNIQLITPTSNTYNYELKATIDPTNIINESDETNNITNINSSGQMSSNSAASISDIIVETAGTDVTINWNSGAADISSILYGTENSDNGINRVAKNSVSTTNHHLTILNLAPNTKYYYKILSNSLTSNMVESSVYDFTTKVSSDTQINEITTNANLLSNDKMGEILAELKELRNIVKEQNAKIKYLEKLTKDVEKLSAKMENAINNFITYGVDANTQKLGEGERAAVMYSYKAAFDKLPETEAELADAIKIANGRWPSITNDAAEKKAKEQFQKIYKRIADMNDAKDNAAITVMAYGLRQKAENRNLNSEKQGINTFKRIYGRTPNSTEDWNIMQAVTYSGASRGIDSDGDLLTDDREEELGTDPKNKDTDGDGYLDGVEVANGFDPLKK